MLKSLKLAMAAALAAAMWPAAAQAQTYTFEKQQIGAWLVYGYKDKCWMMTAVRSGGTKVSLAFGRSSPLMMVAAENRDWTSLEDRAYHDVHVELGTVDETATGYSMHDPDLGPVLGTFLTVDRGIYATLRGTDRIRMSADDKVMVDIPLERNPAAVDYFEKCAQTLKIGPYTGG